ncbi:MAG TPA: hypothetical protein VIN04_10565 [Myxococcota bacterium]
MRAAGAPLLFLLLLAAGARARDVPEEAVVATVPFEQTTERNRIIVDLAPEGRAFP